jgi:hypothetical protein
MGPHSDAHQQVVCLTLSRMSIDCRVISHWDQAWAQRLYVYDICHAPTSQKAERLNRARDLLLRVDQLSDAVEQLAQDCSISPRQAYRYLEQAQRLKQPIPPREAKLAFTVKLPHSLVRRVRTFAAVKGLSISEVVTRALLALLPRGRG